MREPLSESRAHVLAYSMSMQTVHPPQCDGPGLLRARCRFRPRGVLVRSPSQLRGGDTLDTGDCAVQDLQRSIVAYKLGSYHQVAATTARGSRPRAGMCVRFSTTDDILRGLPFVLHSHAANTASASAQCDRPERACTPRGVVMSVLAAACAAVSLRCETLAALLLVDSGRNCRGKVTRVAIPRTAHEYIHSASVVERP